jgi:hypothetical protein
MQLVVDLVHHARKDTSHFGLAKKLLPHFAGHDRPNSSTSGCSLAMRSSFFQKALPRSFPRPAALMFGEIRYEQGW